MNRMKRCLNCKYWKPTAELLGFCERRRLTTVASKRCNKFKPLRQTKPSYTVLLKHAYA